jgi:hypothetical protein
LFEQAKSAIKQEGFDQVIELRGDELDKVQVEIVFRPVPRAAVEAGPPERRPPGPRPSPSAGNKPNARDVKPASPPSSRPPR